ncbi:MAG: hypothetical protein FJW39_17525 [Acidobacteria bacterium]|nr:hypothetical protein [Acidobacteriota bacterium]
MPDPTTQPRVLLTEFRKKVRPDLVTVQGNFAYFCAGPPLTDEDVRDYLDDPIAALPPRVTKTLPRVGLLLVPFIERNSHNELVAFEAPPENKSVPSSYWRDSEGALLAYAIDDMEVAGYHYELYHHLAMLLADMPHDLSEYENLLREELKARTHGEVDEQSWQRKQELLQRSNSPASIRRSKAFREYARQSFIDTMTLYLHGICCDIDVEPGPRQLPSTRLRKRLKLLQSMYPPPQGYAVFPEEIEQAEQTKNGGRTDK